MMLKESPSTSMAETQGPGNPEFPTQGEISYYFRPHNCCPLIDLNEPFKNPKHLEKYLTEQSPIILDYYNRQSDKPLPYYAEGQGYFARISLLRAVEQAYPDNPEMSEKARALMPKTKIFLGPESFRVVMAYFYSQTKEDIERGMRNDTNTIPDVNGEHQQGLLSTLPRAHTNPETNPEAIFVWDREHPTFYIDFSQMNSYQRLTDAWNSALAQFIRELDPATRVNHTRRALITGAASLAAKAMSLVGAGAVAGVTADALEVAYKKQSNRRDFLRRFVIVGGMGVAVASRMNAPAESAGQAVYDALIHDQPTPDITVPVTIEEIRRILPVYTATKQDGEEMVYDYTKFPDN